MKLFIFGFCLFSIVSSRAFSANWMTVSQIQAHSPEGYQLESECKKRGEQCLDVGEDPAIVSRGFASLINDWGPESEEEVCAGQGDCESKLQDKVCPDTLQKFASANWSKVYCVKLLGKVLVKDSAGYASVKSQEFGKAQMDAALAGAKKLRECGERVMDLVLVRNATKGLTTAQVKQMVAVYADIKQLLETGSLNSAKEEIQAVTADGVLVTEGDKTALTQEINKCLTP